MAGSGLREPVHPRRIIRMRGWETGMVDEDVQRSAEELRDTAAKLRALARRTRSPTTRLELVNLAERFEQMAARLDGSGSPQGS